MLCSSLWIPAASTTPLKIEAECLLSTLVNELEKKVEETVLKLCNSLCVYGNEDRGTLPIHFLFSHPIHSGFPVTHCSSQFTFRTCLSLPISLSHIPSCTVLVFLSFSLTASVFCFFILFLNLISIFSSHPSFCTGLSLILCVFLPS